MSQIRLFWKYKELSVMLLVSLSAFILFKFGPMYGLLIAFKNFRVVEGVWGSPWVGLLHFRRLFADPNFYTLFRNTMLINVYFVLIVFPAPIAFAIMLNELRHRWFQRLVQTTTYLPHFISWVIISGLFIYFLSPSMGVVNYVIQLLGFDPVFFMGEKQYLRPLLVLSMLFKELGWNSIIFFAAIAGIDPQLHEAAVMDGAKRWKRIWHITLPCLMPTVVVMLILNVGGFLNTNFEQIYNFLNPLNYDRGDVFETYVYRIGLQQFQYSYTAAIGLFKSVVGLTLVLLTNAIARKASGGEQGLW
ncbi:ABC transporter permease [Cohnella rhizosphaerae]|uniref:ABC transporter permease subunit n=1 Tax=Cohnella rhizosphaerae TaxID=1457232 RepID=A0A9X4KY63_9BACL|nr:ABC transporter permease subunit [Cohnella rhizosphaerae]MDG0810504.1 ABC transporter permease subunit [Cohnella rhizosphaerae]